MTCYDENQGLLMIVHEVVDMNIQNDKNERRIRPVSMKQPCNGICVILPEGKNTHTSYPFHLHSKHSMPWSYWLVKDSKFYIQANACQGVNLGWGEVYRNCEALTSSVLYVGIMDRIKNGAHENVPLAYHRVGGLVTIIR